MYTLVMPKYLYVWVVATRRLIAQMGKGMGNRLWEGGCMCARACAGGLHLEAREDLGEDLRLDDDLGELDRMLCDLREAHAHLCVSTHSTHMHTCV